MKNERIIMIAIAVYAAAMVMIFNMLGAHAQNADPVKNPNVANEKKFDRDAVNDGGGFPGKSADARMMNVQEIQKSMDSEDLQVLAVEYLPMTPSYLEKFKKIKIATE